MFHVMHVLHYDITHIMQLCFMTSLWLFYVLHVITNTFVTISYFPETKLFDSTHVDYFIKLIFRHFMVMNLIIKLSLSHSN